MLYIFEGMDNCGKTTAIQSLMAKNKNPKRMVLHSSKPPHGVDPVSWSTLYYNSILQEALDLSDDGWDIYMDRAHLGEYVYGPIYRDTSGDWIFELEEHLEIQDRDDVELIVLVGEKEGLLNRDDGKSISTDNLLLECELFCEAFTKSKILNGNIINVDVEGFHTLDEYINYLAAYKE